MTVRPLALLALLLAAVALVAAGGVFSGPVASPAAWAQDPPDEDGDGVPGPSDNCRYTPNADQKNSDGDELGDACDSNVNGDSGTIDPSCPSPSGVDTDADGRDDACDPDDDADSVADGDDRCPLVAGPDGGCPASGGGSGGGGTGGGGTGGSGGTGSSEPGASGAGTATGTSGTGTGPATTGGASAGRAVSDASAAFVRQLRKGGVRALLRGLRIPARAPAKGTFKLTVEGAVGSSRSARAAAVVVLAQGTAQARRAGTVTVRVTATRRGKSLLRRAKSAGVAVKTSFTPSGAKRPAAQRRVPLSLKTGR